MNINCRNNNTIFFKPEPNEVAALLETKRIILDMMNVSLDNEILIDKFGSGALRTIYQAVSEIADLIWEGKATTTKV